MEDIGLRQVKGKHEVKFYLGKEDKSLVIEKYYGERKHSDLAQLQLALLVDVLNIKIIEELREKIGVFFGSPETTTGGKALKFYASVRMDIRRIETLKDGQESVGNRTRVKVVKNKMAPPFKQAEFDIIYGVGISREGSLLDMGVELGIVKKSGAWYTYEGDQLGQGKENSRAFLIDNPDLAAEIEKKIRESFVPVAVDPALIAEIDEAAAEVEF